MSESKPTPAPTPWDVEYNGDADAILDETGDLVAEVYAPGEASRIVRAVNSHEALVEALKALVDRVAYYAPSMDREGDLDAARAALELAGVKL